MGLQVGDEARLVRRGEEDLGSMVEKILGFTVWGIVLFTDPKTKEIGSEVVVWESVVEGGVRTGMV